MLKDKPLPTISVFMIAEESRDSGNSTLCQVPRVPCHRALVFSKTFPLDPCCICWAPRSAQDLYSTVQHLPGGQEQREVSPRTERPGGMPESAGGTEQNRCVDHSRAYAGLGGAMAPRSCSHISSQPCLRQFSTCSSPFPRLHALVYCTRQKPIKPTPPWVLPFVSTKPSHGPTLQSGAANLLQ